MENGVRRIGFELAWFVQGRFLCLKRAWAPARPVVSAGRTLPTSLRGEMLSLFSCLVPQEGRFFLSRRGLHRQPSPHIAPSSSICLLFPLLTGRQFSLRILPAPSSPLPLRAGDTLANSLHLSSINLPLFSEKDSGAHVGVRKIWVQILSLPLPLSDT